MTDIAAYLGDDTCGTDNLVDCVGFRADGEGDGTVVAGQHLPYLKVNIREKLRKPCLPLRRGTEGVDEALLN